MSSSSSSLVGGVLVIFSMKRYYMSGRDDHSPLRTTCTTIDGSIHESNILNIFMGTPLGAFLLSHRFMLKFVKFTVSMVDCGVVHVHLEPSLHIITDNHHLRYFNIPCIEIFGKDCGSREQYQWMKEQVLNHGRQSSEIIVEARSMKAPCSPQCSPPWSPPCPGSRC